MNYQSLKVADDTISYVEQLRARAAAFDLIDIEESAKLLGKCVRTVRRMEAAGLMPKRTKHGHRMKYSKRDIAAMIATQSGSAPT